MMLSLVTLDVHHIDVAVHGCMCVCMHTLCIYFIWEMKGRVCIGNRARGLNVLKSKRRR